MADENLLDGINSRSDTVEVMTGRLEVTEIETIQNETWRQNKKKRTEYK